jgi:hypothetical protein
MLALMDAKIRSRWLTSLLSTESAERPRAEAALRNLYAAAKPQALVPAHIFWFDSPFAAGMAVAVLAAAHDNTTRSLVEGLAQQKRGREIVERTRAALCERAQRDWDAITPDMGPRLFEPYSIRHTLARMELHQSLGGDLPDTETEDPLSVAEWSFRDVLSGQQDPNCLVKTQIQYSFHNDYRFYEMAADELAAAGKQVPPLIAAAWEVARSAGLWWPFRGGAVLSERPVELHLNERSLLHRHDGPAGSFRDGSRFWAWNGKPMWEQWLTHPEELRPTQLRSLDRTFQAWVRSTGKKAKPKHKPKPSTILKADLPAKADNRLAVLREHNQSSLPLFDRYTTGAHEEVWKELLALGSAIREDPHAADALAVAYETMRRVRANVETVTARLQAFAYQHALETTLHQPPGPKTRKLIARLEKKAGVLPLSLRAFYDVVGAVDWTGHHPTIAPRESGVPPDPLVVWPIEIAVEQSDFGEDGDETRILIAPDEVLKAGDAGGDAFTMEAPNPRADGKLIDEGHDTWFVEYLRIAFRFGGFPGYDGVETPPAELEELRAGLIAF